MAPRAPFALLLLLLTPTSSLGADGGLPVAVFEAPPAEAVEQGKIAYQKWEDKAAAEHGVVNYLLGNTCFTTAMAQLGRECSRMDGPQRMWLAIQFTMCFLRASGFKPLHCPATCPKHKWLQSCVEECTGRMDDKAHITYVAFFGDVFNMCLYLQAQSFQQRTAALVQEMHGSALAANSSLANIAAQLSRQEASLLSSMDALASVQAAQQRLVGSVQAGLSEVKKVGEASAGLQSSMAESLQRADEVGSRQLQLLAGFEDLEGRQRQAAGQAAAAWEQLTAGAAALELRQARYESLQAQLLNTSEGLLSQSAGMAQLLHVLLQYQHTGSSLLSHLTATSTSLQDLGFYCLALAVPLVFFTHPPDLRLLLLLSVGLSWIAERLVLQNYLALRRAFARSGPGGTATAAAALAAGGGHAAKLAVRALLLGAGCCLVLVVLARRAQQRRKREEVFEQIRQAMLGAWGHPGAGPAYGSYGVPHHPAAAMHPVHAPMLAADVKPSIRGGNRRTAAAAAEQHQTSAACPVVADLRSAPTASKSLALVVHAQQQQQQQQQQQADYPALPSTASWLHHLSHSWLDDQPHITPPALTAAPYALADQHQQQQHQQQPPATAAAMLRYGAGSSAAGAAAAAAAAPVQQPERWHPPPQAADAAADRPMRESSDDSAAAQPEQDLQRLGRRGRAAKPPAGAAMGKAAGAKRGRAAAPAAAPDAADEGEEQGEQESAEAGSRQGAVPPATGRKTKKRQAR